MSELGFFDLRINGFFDWEIRHLHRSEPLNTWQLHREGLQRNTLNEVQDIVRKIVRNPLRTWNGKPHAIQQRIRTNLNKCKYESKRFVYFNSIFLPDVLRIRFW